MPEGPFLYPPDDVTDLSDEQRITELIREHATLVGGHSIRQIYEIGGDVSPDDFD